MKRVAIIILIIVLVALCGVGIYFVFFNSKEPIVQPPITVTPPVDENKDKSELIEVSTAETKTETLRRVVNVQMPTFMNLSNYTFQESMNKKIVESIDPYITEIAIVADESVPATTVYHYDVTYERYNNEDYLSLVVSQNYSTGGMRSNIWKDTYTIDVVNNKELSLADVCSSSDYKKIIVDEINRQAVQRNIELIAGNGLADIPDTQSFYIKDKKLFIYFEPASIAPYLDGDMHFEMPYEFVNGKFIVK